MVMKRILPILLACTMLVMCKSKKTTAEAKAEIADGKPEVQYRDDFREATDKERAALLKKLRATDAAYSVLILTKGFKGEKVVVSTSGKTIYSGTFISNLKSGIAGPVRIQSGADTKVYDSFSKNEVIIPAEDAKKHKYIYLMKDNANKSNPFTITYSNTLRPLK